VRNEEPEIESLDSVEEAGKQAVPPAEDRIVTAVGSAVHVRMSAVVEVQVATRVSVLVQVDPKVRLPQPYDVGYVHELVSVE
jgi:hypothetical protein